MAEHKNIGEALLAVQAAAPTLPKDAINPHFRSKFTPLDTIVERIGPLLAEHGLTWSTFPCFGPNGEPALRYKLRHVASGETDEDTMPLLVAKSDPQGQGAAITYGRRYTISAVLNLVSDEDTDAQGVKGDQDNGGARTVAPANGPEPKLLNNAQRARVLDAIEAANVPLGLILSALGLGAPDELTVTHAKRIKEEFLP